MKLPNGPGRHFSITLPEGATDELDALAARRGTYRGSVAREAILDWLSRQPAKRTDAPGDDAAQ